MLALLLCAGLVVGVWLVARLLMGIVTLSQQDTMGYHRVILIVVAVAIVLALTQALVGLSTHVLPLTLSRML